LDVKRFSIRFAGSGVRFFAGLTELGPADGLSKKKGPRLMTQPCDFPGAAGIEPSIKAITNRYQGAGENSTQSDN
jgi:hypothetical protein